MNKNKLLISLSMSACLALNVVANDKVSLGTISVDDTALEAHIKSIDLESLDNSQASDIKDILKSMPSVIVSGNARYSQKVFIRGLEDKSSNITIDGAKMSGQLFHHSGDQTIDAEMLKIGSIELGPNSALSGPGVINGSFVYETKDASDFLEKDEKFGGKISTSYQSGYEKKSTALSLFGKVNEKFEFIGIGNYSKDGSLHTPDKANEESKKSTLKSGLVKLVYKINPNNKVKLSYNKYQDGGNRQLSAEKPGTDNTNNPYNEIVRDTYTLNYEYNPNNDLIKLSTKVYTNSQKLNRDAYVSGTRSVSAQVYENKVSGLDLRNTSILDNHSLTYGVEAYKEEQSKEGSQTEAGITTLTGAIGKGIVNSKSVYFEDEIILDKLKFNLGLRYDIHKLGGLYSGTNKQLSPKFKASYQISENLSLRTGYGRIFKGPSLGETLSLSDNSVQSENSKAQTGHNIEVGFDYDLSTALNADSSKFGFTAYKYNVDNYMHETKNDEIANQTNVEIFGFETMFSYKQDALKLNLSHTYTGGNHVSLSNGSKYNPATAKIHAFKISTDYAYNNNLSLNYNSELVPGNTIMSSSRGTVSETKRRGYGVHNISGTYKVAALKGAKISLGIDNLFDKQYTRHTNFGTSFGSESYTSYEVGRNVKVKLSYRF